MDPLVGQSASLMVGQTAGQSLKRSVRWCKPLGQSQDPVAPIRLRTCCHRSFGVGAMDEALCTNANSCLSVLCATKKKIIMLKELIDDLGSANSFAV